MKYQSITHILLACLLYIIALPAFADSKEAYSDSMVRAAVIFGILRFTDWPSIKSDQDTITLCTYGRSSSILAINQLKKIPNIGKKSVTLKTNMSVDKMNICHAIIVGRGAKALDKLEDSILLICDECDERQNDIFAINLIQQDSRIQFSINLDRIKEQQLNLSASLIELAASCSSSDPNIRACND